MCVTFTEQKKLNEINKYLGETSSAIELAVRRSAEAHVKLSELQNSLPAYSAQLVTITIVGQLLASIRLALHAIGEILPKGGLDCQ